MPDEPALAAAVLRLVTLRSFNAPFLVVTILERVVEGKARSEEELM